MSGPRLGRQTLARASRSSLKRLARYVGESPTGPTSELVERLARRLDSTDAWPPRATERRW